MSIFESAVSHERSSREAAWSFSEGKRAEVARVVEAIHAVMRPEIEALKDMYRHDLPEVSACPALTADGLKFISSGVGILLTVHARLQPSPRNTDPEGMGVRIEIAKGNPNLMQLSAPAVSFLRITSLDSVNFSRARNPDQSGMDLSFEIAERMTPQSSITAPLPPMTIATGHGSRSQRNEIDVTPQVVVAAFIREVCKLLDMDSIRTNEVIPRPVPENKLAIAGHEFTLIGHPGREGGRIESKWAFAEFDEFGEASDESSPARVACAVIEAQILALYCSGALIKDYAFNPEVVKALETSIDAIAGILSRHARDESPSPFDRPH
jgi:hypothetical protein